MSQESQMQEWMPNQETPTSLIDMDSLVKELAEARQKYADAKEVSSKLYHDLEEVEQRVMGALKANGRTKYEAEGVASVRVQTKDMFSVPQDVEAKRALYAYISQKYGPETLTAMLSIHSQRLNSWANKEIESDPGLQIPGLQPPTTAETLYFSGKK